MTVKVTVRYFAAARVAAGLDDEIVGVPPGTTISTLVHNLGERDPDLAKVLRRCSYLCDGIAVRDLGLTLGNAQTVDVLPPFAGG
ncbi:MAG TPA: MoaD/ThiS family protein [Mycobacterium sp.]|nr:MoaD/ThiS family protein [Mycobacterium sp.]